MNAPANKKKAAAGNKKRARPLVDKTCEGCVDLCDRCWGSQNHSEFAAPMATPAASNSR